MERIAHFCSIFLFVLLFSCTDDTETKNQQSGESGPPISEQNPNSQIGKEPSLNVCDCFSPDIDQSCINHRISVLKKSLNDDEIARQLIDSECYTQLVAEAEAKKLCDCINRFGQAGLKCDELQKELDKTYSDIEQMAITAAFKKLDCFVDQ